MNAIAGGVQRLYDLKLHGLRWVNLIGFACVAAMVFSVYVAKAGAARQGAQISEIEREIDATQRRVRLLRAEVARLEQPGRLEALSRQIGLEPIDVHHRAVAAELPTLKPRPLPQPAPAPQPEAEPDPAPAATQEAGQ